MKLSTLPSLLCPSGKKRYFATCKTSSLVESLETSTVLVPPPDLARKWVSVFPSLRINPIRTCLISLLAWTFPVSLVVSFDLTEFVSKLPSLSDDGSVMLLFSFSFFLSRLRTLDFLLLAWYFSGVFLSQKVNSAIRSPNFCR